MHRQETEEDERDQRDSEFAPIMLHKRADDEQNGDECPNPSDGRQLVSLLRKAQSVARRLFDLIEQATNIKQILGRHHLPHVV